MSELTHAHYREPVPFNPIPIAEHLGGSKSKTLIIELNVHVN